VKCEACGVGLIRDRETLICPDGCGWVYKPSTGLVDAIEDVKNFHRAMNQPVHEELHTPDDARVRLRAELILEECQETIASMFDCDSYPAHSRWDDTYGPAVSVDHVKLADGLADLIYVCIGAANEFGIDLAAVWAEVHRSNMAKIGPNGEVKRREDGKVVKPDGWTPPDIEGVLYGKVKK